MLGMMAGLNPIHLCLRTIDREMLRSSDHRVSRIDQIRSVHLDLAVVLSADESCSQDQREGRKREREISVTHHQIGVTTTHGEDYQLQNEFGVANR